MGDLFNPDVWFECFFNFLTNISWVGFSPSSGKRETPWGKITTYPIVALSIHLFTTSISSCTNGLPENMITVSLSSTLFLIFLSASLCWSGNSFTNLFISPIPHWEMSLPLPSPLLWHSHAHTNTVKLLKLLHILVPPGRSFHFFHLIVNANSLSLSYTLTYT